ncbi:MAG: DNA primase [Prevotella sp.]|nr:DNA primase [Prevotella sp.]
MSISEEQKEEVKAKVDISDLVSSYGFTLKPRGSELWCCCPFHNEKTPSFKVDVTRGTYRCFGCGECGDVIDFVMKHEGLSFGDTMRKLASMAGVELKSNESVYSKTRKRLLGLMSDLAIDFNKMLRSPKCIEAEMARNYLKGRKLDSQTADKFLIGWAPKETWKILKWADKHGYSSKDLSEAGIIKESEDKTRAPYFYFANRLVFSIKDKNGQVVAFSGRQLIEDKKSGKYVNSPETIIFKKSRTLFAFDEARKNIVKAPNREAIVCEGQIDCIRLHSNGFNTAVAPLGTAFTEEHAIMLHRVADNALLCFDDDGAGHKATIKAAQLLLAEGMPIRVLSLPDGEDPDSYIVNHGKEAFSNLLEKNAESIVQFQIRAARSVERNPDDTNASVRITKSVLDTISKCKDKVHRTLLLKEAARSLGVEYSILAEEIVQSVKVANEEKKNESEQLIESIVAGDSADVNNPPSLAEGTFINFLLTKNGDPSIRSYVEKLIPIEIIGSNTTKKIIKSVLEFTECGDDSIRNTIESLSTDEYKNFIDIMANFDESELIPLPEKLRILYFARQLWHDYLVKMLKHGNNKDTVVKAIKVLHTANAKGTVNLIQSFPIKKFSVVA